MQQESLFPACTTHSTALFTPLRAIRRWKLYKRPLQRTWTLARSKKHMGNIAQGLRTCPYQEPTAKRPVLLSRSRFTCTASRYQKLPQRALASEKIKRGSWGGLWSVFAHLEQYPELKSRECLPHTNLHSAATCGSLNGGRAYVKTVRRAEAARDPGPRGLTSTRGLHMTQRGSQELYMCG